MRDYKYGEYLYNLRKSFNMSQAQLGKELGISNKAVSKWENGESKPALQQLYKLSKIFSISIEELLEIYKNNKKVYKIVITGGPCAGKSTAMSIIRDEFIKKGYAVVTIPESATEMLSSGITYTTMSSTLEFQRAVIQDQIYKERVFESAIKNIKTSDKILIVCDRGVMDGKAYLSEFEWSQILRSLGINEVEIRDNYDAVFHLVTAADGAEEYYTKDNNIVRVETSKEAIEADKKTLKAWTGHPYLRIIDNSTNFDGKISKLLTEINKFIGEPETYEIERKFLISMPDLDKIESQAINKVDINQTYLKTINNEELRIRQRGSNGNYVYTKTKKINVTDIKRIEKEERIGVSEYLSLLMDADPNYNTIRKTRYCLVYNNQYIEIDIYPNWKDRAILEIELKDENQSIVLPPEIKVIKEVTNDPEYKNKNLAKK